MPLLFYAVKASDILVFLIFFLEWQLFRLTFFYWFKVI